MSHNTSVVVSRASQVHQMPQITRAQILPVTMLTSEKTTETSTMEAARESYLRSLLARYQQLMVSATK